MPRLLLDAWSTESRENASPLGKFPRTAAGEQGWRIDKSDLSPSWKLGRFSAGTFVKLNREARARERVRVCVTPTSRVESPQYARPQLLCPLSPEITADPAADSSLVIIIAPSVSPLCTQRCVLLAAAENKRGRVAFRMEEGGLKRMSRVQQRGKGVEWSDVITTSQGE